MWLDRCGGDRAEQENELYFSAAVVLFRNEALLQEKEELAELFEAFKSEVMLSRDGAAAKQIKILKQAIRNLEVCVCVRACMCVHV